MALTTGNADAVATGFCAANGITDTAAIAKWKSFCEQLYVTSGGALVTAIDVTLPATSVTTNGSPTSQVGPPSPVTLTVS